MNNLKELCKDISFNRISNWMNITQTKRVNAKASLGINNEEIILFYDSTLFESGKNGLAICESGVYWKDSFCSPGYLNWESLKKVKLQYDKTNIYFGDRGSFFAYESEIKDLANALNYIRINIKIQGFVSFIKDAIDYVTGPNIQQLIEQVEMAKSSLTYLNNDYIGEFINAEINNQEEFEGYFITVVASAVSLTADKDILDLFDEDMKETVFVLKSQLDPQVELVETILNSEIMDQMDIKRVSLKKAINLYNHRIKVSLEDYDDQNADSGEIYESTQVALMDFRKSLNGMIKNCNLLIEKSYEQ